VRQPEWWRNSSEIERLAFVWWLTIVVAAFVTLGTRSWTLAAFVGLLTGGLGVVLALNHDGLADRLSDRRVIVAPFWRQRSRTAWRISGGLLALLGAGWIVGGLLATFM